VYSNSPFKPRDHYQYYLIAAYGGELLGRSNGMIFSYCGKITGTFSLCPYSGSKPWVVIILDIAMLIVIVLITWFRIVSNVWLVLALSFVEGLVCGVSYVGSFAVVSERKGHIAFTRAATIIVHGACGTTGAMTAIVLEPIMRQHCFEVTKSSQYCIARYMGIGRKPCYSTG
jgi:MFS family permease